MDTLLLQITRRFIESQIGDERISNILWCAGIVLVTMLVKRPLSRFIAKLSAGVAHRFSDKNEGALFQNLTVRPLENLLQTLLYYVALNQLSIFLNQVIFRRVYSGKTVEIRVSDVADKVFMLLLIVFFILVISRIVDFVFHVLIRRAFAEDDKDKEQLLPLVKEIAKILLWATGLFWILGSVFNVNIPALITGLGIGGVAIALAAKESVENFFAAFTILTDKPFQTNDVVKLGGIEGTVERIGFRSTKLRTGDGSLFIVPNKKLVNENLENLTRRNTRKVRTVLNLKYGISHENLERLLADLKSTVAQAQYVRQPVIVLLESFGEAAMQISVSYFLPEPMPAAVKVDTVKQEVHLKAYRLIAAYDSSAIPAGNADKKEDNSEHEETKDGDDLL